MRQLLLHLNKTQPEMKREVVTENRAELFLFIKLAVDPISSPQAWQENQMSDQKEIFYLPILSQAARKEQAQDGSKLSFVYNLTTGSRWALNTDIWFQPFLMTNSCIFFSSMASFSAFMTQTRHHCIIKDWGFFVVCFLFVWGFFCMLLWLVFVIACLFVSSSELKMT